MTTLSKQGYTKSEYALKALDDYGFKSSDDLLGVKKQVLDIIRTEEPVAQHYPDDIRLVSFAVARYLRKNTSIEEWRLSKIENPQFTSEFFQEIHFWNLSLKMLNLYV